MKKRIKLFVGVRGKTYAKRKHSDGFVHRLFNKLIAQRSTDKDCAADTSVKISSQGVEN